mmetsp:Transcript_56868/g.158319  ORF Transcript_56868/g.158319 Transcript_56868/m.158319 type:complete len:332 (+) Transcript_56868:377-1372(+)
MGPGGGLSRAGARSALVAFARSGAWTGCEHLRLRDHRWMLILVEPHAGAPVAFARLGSFCCLGTRRWLLGHYELRRRRVQGTVEPHARVLGGLARNGGQSRPGDLAIPDLRVLDAAAEGLVAELEVAAQVHARPVHGKGRQAIHLLAREHPVLEHLHVPRVRDRAQHRKLLSELEEIVHSQADRLLAPENGEVQVESEIDGPCSDAVLVGLEGEVEHAGPAVDALHRQCAHEREGPPKPPDEVWRQVDRVPPRQRVRILDHRPRGVAAGRRWGPRRWGLGHGRRRLNRSEHRQDWGRRASRQVSHRRGWRRCLLWKRCDHRMRADTRESVA